MNSSTSRTEIAFVTCACAKDIHYAKSLLGSISFFYPSHLIHIILDSDVPNRDEQQLRRFPNVTVHSAKSLPSGVADDLSGLLTKLRMLLIPGITRAIFADADSILVGPVLNHIDETCAIHCLHSQALNFDNPSEKASFYRWAVDVRQLPLELKTEMGKPHIFMQGSHFYINKALFPMNLVRSLRPYMGTSHASNAALRAGDQGFFNYVVNAADSIRCAVKCSSVTLQVGQSPHDSSFDNVCEFIRGETDKIYFLHYVGNCRCYLRQRHEYSAALTWGTRLYYEAVGRTEFIPDEIRRTLRVISRTALGGLRLLWKPFVKQRESE